MCVSATHEHELAPVQTASWALAAGEDDAPRQIRSGEATRSELSRRATVMVTAAGSIVAQGIMKCLKLAGRRDSGIKYSTVATDMAPLAAGLFRADRAFILPSPDEEVYVDRVTDVCRRQGVDAVYAGSDEELLTLARAKDRIEKESGARVLTTSVAAIETAQDKWLTHGLLTRASLPFARSALPDAAGELVSQVGFPVVVKPRGGHGSLMLSVCRTGGEMELAMKRVEEAGMKAVVQEYVGDDKHEYTVGLTVSREGNRILSSIAMKRVLKAGQTYRAFVDSFPEARKLGEKVALALGGGGAINVQLRGDGDGAKVFEINPRFSASTPIRAFAGVNEPDIVFRDAVLGEDPLPGVPSRLVAMRYWNEVYVDWDDYSRLIEKGQDDSPSSVIPDYF